MARVYTRAQKAAAKRKRAESKEATSAASKKWKTNNPDGAKKGHELFNETVSIHTWHTDLLALLLMWPLQRSEASQVAAQETKNPRSIAMLRPLPHLSEDFMAWLQLATGCLFKKGGAATKNRVVYMSTTNSNSIRSIKAAH